MSDLFEEYIQITDETAVYPGVADTIDGRGGDKLTAVIYCTLGLAGEAGEVVDVVKKNWRNNDELNVEKITDELGDLMWYVARLCRELDIEMQDILEGNVTKLRARKDAGTLKVR